MPRTTYAIPLPLHTEKYDCTITTITNSFLSVNNNLYYTYILQLSAHAQQKWRACMFVPAHYVTPDFRDLADQHGAVSVPENHHTRCRLALGPVIAEDLSRDVYIRQAEAPFKHKGQTEIYIGEVHIPRGDLAEAVNQARRKMEKKEQEEAREHLMRKREESEALESVEEVPPPSAKKRMVEFKGVWTLRSGRKVDIEVWGEDGRQSYRGRGKILEVEVKNPGSEGKGGNDGNPELEVRKVYLETMVPDAENMMVLVGELKMDMRVGPFEEERK